MKRRGARARPPIPPWVVDIRFWPDFPDMPHQDRNRLWGEATWEWLERYGYDVFDLNDAAVGLRQEEGS